MKKMKIFLVALASTVMLLSACNNQQPNQPSEFEVKTREIYELYVADGGTLSYEEWLESIKGVDGQDGHSPVVEIGSDGYWYIDGVNTGVKALGEDGDNGQNGLTPYIGENGNWWIGDNDTGVHAQGNTGSDGTGVKDMYFNGEGELIIVLDDDTVINLGKVDAVDHKHDYEIEVVDPTCTTDGSITMTCKTCNHVEVVINKASGHQYEQWREIIAPSCTAEGKKVRYCTVCGDRQEEIIEKHDHQISDHYVYNSVTHWHLCELCGVVVDEENHHFSENTCDVCGYEKPSSTSEDGFIYKLNEDQESYSLIDIGTNETKDIVIPEKYNGKPVTAIGKEAFCGTDITSVTMTNAILTIGDGCFKNCKQLTKAVLSKSLTKLAPSLFAECEKLVDVTIPYGVEELGERVFVNCLSIESMIIPNSVTIVGGFCIYNCKKLEKLVLSSSIHTMGSFSFGYTRKLTDLVIPEGCKVIGISAFVDCELLESVYIPKSMVKIGSKAFEDCELLKSAMFGETDNWYSNGEPIAKEILQDDAAAARKLINSTSLWERIVG